MNTIQKVLIGNSRNKLEFKRVNGYEFLTTLFSQKENEGQEILRGLF